MKNSKLQAFESKVSQILNNQIITINKNVEGHLANFNQIMLVPFNNQSPYDGEVKNLIFFTYSDHYRGNSGVDMDIEHLYHPHTNMEDRGYMKGVVTDLNGYMKLRSAKNIEHNLSAVANISLPRFKKSKHSVEYSAVCSDIINVAAKQLNELVAAKVEEMSDYLNQLTGCSLLYYLRNI